MSLVTNCILGFSIVEHETARWNDVNNLPEDINNHTFVSIDDPKLPRKWYGGTKMFETHLGLASVNYFCKDLFFEHLKSIKWERPEEVQLMLMEQDDNIFTIYYPCRKEQE